MCNTLFQWKRICEFSQNPLQESCKNPWCRDTNFHFSTYRYDYYIDNPYIVFTWWECPGYPILLWTVWSTAASCRQCQTCWLYFSTSSNSVLFIIYHQGCILRRRLQHQSEKKENIVWDQSIPGLFLLFPVNCLPRI